MSGFRFKALVSVYIEAAGSGGGAGRAGTSVFPTRKGPGGAYRRGMSRSAKKQTS